MNLAMYNDRQDAQKCDFLSRVSDFMGRETSTLLPKHERLLTDLGENLRLARLRRKLSAEQVAERAGGRFRVWRGSFSWASVRLGFLPVTQGDA